jgi:excisionase family DNA binding protein
MGSDSLLTPADVAHRCGLSRKAVYRAIDRGELKAFRLCSRLRIDPEAVDAWLEASVVTGSEPLPIPCFLPAPLPRRNGLRRFLSEG